VASEKTPDGDYKLAQLVRANRGLYDITTAYGVPLISGKDSMKNDYQIGNTKISIPPTILFSVIGKIADVNRAVTMDAKRPGDLIYVLGPTKNELGGSEYLASKGLIGNRVPVVDIENNLRRYRALSAAIAGGLLASVHDLSDAGLGTAVAESAFAGDLGMEIELAAVIREGVDRDDFLLFSESAGRFVVTVKPEDAERFEKIMAGTAFARVGRVTEEKRLVVRGLAGAVVIDVTLDDVREAWQRPLMS
jgi:phosphoribosylformylglycinamidine (FGAM) synthase-like enzyme